MEWLDVAALQSLCSESYSHLSSNVSSFMMKVLQETTAEIDCLDACCNHSCQLAKFDMWDVAA